jgi:hypothetical protein
VHDDDSGPHHLSIRCTKRLAATGIQRPVIRAGNNSDGALAEIDFDAALETEPTAAQPTSIKIVYYQFEVLIFVQKEDI